MPVTNPNTEIKTITTNTGAATVCMLGYTGVCLALLLSGVTGGNFTFEGSPDSTDGTNGTWFATTGVRANSNTAESVTGAISVTPAYTWDIPTEGYSFFRVRATAGTFGTATVVLAKSKTMSDNQPFVQVAGTTTVSGTVNTTPTTPTQSFVNSVATTNATNTKASAGTLFSVFASNVNAAARYLKLYNKASAPTVGTDVPVMVVPIPATSCVSLNLGAQGVRFGTGIAFALTTGAADSDTTAVAANEIKVALSYI